MSSRGEAKKEEINHLCFKAKESFWSVLKTVSQKYERRAIYHDIIKLYSNIFTRKKTFLFCVALDGEFKTVQ